MAAKKKQGIEKDKDKIMKIILLERHMERHTGMSPHNRRINVQS